MAPKIESAVAGRSRRRNARRLSLHQGKQMLEGTHPASAVLSNA
jgi:hypothetical protein